MITRQSWTLVFAFTFAACATTPGANPHDMSASEHEGHAEAQAKEAEGHASQYDPSAKVERRRCSPRTGCWTSVQNPTAEHKRIAEEHQRQAADHRAASAALRDAEARACVDIEAADRDQSPFERVEDIASVEPLLDRVGTSKTATQRIAGAIVTFRAVPGMTAEWLQRVVDCHLARNSALGHVMPDMPNCPLVPKGAEARVTSTGTGFAVTIRANDAETAREILSRAQRLGVGPKAEMSAP